MKRRRVKGAHCRVPHFVHEIVKNTDMFYADKRTYAKFTKEQRRLWAAAEACGVARGVTAHFTARLRRK